MKKLCRGILTFLIAVVGINSSSARSLMWQYGKPVSRQEAQAATAPSQDLQEKTLDVGSAMSQSASAVSEGQASAPSAEAATSSTASSETKTAGLNPKISGSKLTLQVASLLESQWGLLKTPGLNIKDAWNLLISKKAVKATKAFSCAASPIVVAIIDTGVDFTHQNLKGVEWVNEKELHGKKGVDDDGDGLVDDINGWDFTTNSPIIVDGHGHGSHLAGIIAGTSPEPNGFKGVCPGIKIMSLRYFASDLTGLKNLENTVKAIKYATRHGANIINYSGGGASFAHDEYMALKEATDKGILVVAAAGNERSDTAKHPYFPASYDLKNIISVAAVGSDGKLIPASNWGNHTVDVAAPGGGILSLQQNQSYGFMNGTSQATAFVSGLAGLIWTMNPKLKAADVKEIVEKSVVKSKFLKNKTITEGTVDAVVAMQTVMDYKMKIPVKLKADLKKAAKTRILSGLQGAPARPTEKTN